MSSMLGCIKILLETLRGINALCCNGSTRRESKKGDRRRKFGCMSIWRCKREHFHGKRLDTKLRLDKGKTSQGEKRNKRKER